MTEETQRLEQQIAQTRSRLAADLDALGERRGRVVAAFKTLTRPPASIVIAAAVGLVATVLIVRRARTRRAQQRFHVLRALLEPAPRQSGGFLAQGFQRAALSLLPVLVKRAGRGALERWSSEAGTYPPRPADPRAYVAGA